MDLMIDLEGQINTDISSFANLSTSVLKLEPFLESVLEQVYGRKL